MTQPDRPPAESPEIRDNPLLDARENGATAQPGIADIISFLRQQNKHDFSLYRPGTAQRRIERRMALAALAPHDVDRYLDVLRRDPQEVDVLARDLLVSVTAFFRDPAAFQFLAESIVPRLVEKQPADEPLRLWVPGCSSGEEAYSLTMLFLEEIRKQGRSFKLQMFASDVDPEAIGVARDGLYPASIEADVSPKRLQQFFSREESGYRVRSDVRSCVIFSVSDLLSDPPFSRMDFISCRNLLVHLLPEAQEKAIALFHFALRNNGILFLGNAETVVDAEGRFEVLSAPNHVYRQIGTRRSGDFDFLRQPWDGSRTLTPRGLVLTRTRQAMLADHCSRLMTDALSAAAVLINRRDECLHFLGRVERYLEVTPGQPTLDILALAQRSLRPKLRAAIQQARSEKSRFALRHVQMEQQDETITFSIDVQPTEIGGEELWFVCFREDSSARSNSDMLADSHAPSRIVALEEELEATRRELDATIHTLEAATEEQRIAYEESMSINEEFQSANEELVTSKEELQALNEELAALNGQLQETLSRQETTSTDLQNVLYSTEEAILFLDSAFNIRFFTPATKSLFNVLPSDVGRPLEDLNPLIDDPDLLGEAAEVLAAGQPKEREVRSKDGQWFARCIRPYRTFDGKIEGIVITFSDITALKQTAEALETAKSRAEQANLAKSHFLAAASHDLRQPLQTMALVQGLLARTTDGAPDQKLVTLLDQTLVAMSGMLNTLLDLNQIDAGIEVNRTRFSISVLMGRLRDEFAYHAQARGIDLRMVTCRADVVSDPLLLEQMVRYLLTNALKYAERGKVLLGCRRRGNTLCIQVCDTGSGTPADEIEAIFEAYHQSDHPAGEGRKGLGLGLSIVQRLGILLGHRVDVTSEQGRGSVFTITIDLAAADVAADSEAPAPNAPAQPRPATILVIEDDREVRDMLTLFLLGESHQVTATSDGAAALDLVTRGPFRPDIIITDYKLSRAPDGIEVVKALRDKFLCDIPAILLTGDFSDPLRDHALPQCQQLQKPVKARDLSATIARLQLPTVPPLAFGKSRRESDTPTIFVVDDDAIVRQMLRELLEAQAYLVEDYRTAEDFLTGYLPGGPACLLVDAYLPGMSGVDLLEKIAAANLQLPSIMITGKGDSSTAVQAVNAGALEFFEKPADPQELVASVQRALEQSRMLEKHLAWKVSAAENLAGLTARQQQILSLILSGMPNKLIAAELGISQRTVENHRAEIMKKTGVASLPELARLALAANWSESHAALSHDEALP